VALCLLESKAPKPELQVFDNATTLGVVRQGDEATAISLLGSGKSGARIVVRNGKVFAEFDPSASPRQNTILYWHGPTDELPELVRTLTNGTAREVPADLRGLSRPGPGRWQPLQTKGQPSLSLDAYVIETLAIPYQNPWKALFFTSGIDFLPNGDAAVCTIHGDVWLVSGIDEKLRQLTWRRFATGLFQPLGLKVVNGRAHVLGRDQITVLHDQNDDGEADFYENFSNLIETSAGGHDYVTSLNADEAGNFYYVDPHGVHRISADGRHRDTIATGWRNPNGMGVSQDGKIITVAPQEGEWTPASAICEARREGYYGYGGPKTSAERPLGYDAPLCWIPHRVDNSSGGQLWVTSDRWGPLRGQMLHLSYGRCSMMLCLREVVNGQPQGGVVPLKGRFLSGAMRGAFRSQDGQLYVVGSRGWQTSALQDGCLQRVRYTGKKVYLPTALHAHSNGLVLTFTEPIRSDTAEDAGSFGINELFFSEYCS
jgi:glucose/arabinose dehydrogenase